MEGLKYIYQIPVIVPLENVGLGGYGFGVDLDSNFGIKARKEIMPLQTKKIFIKQGCEIVEYFFGKKFKMNPYMFAEDSWLVHVIGAPGDACDIALDESGLNYFFGSGWEELQKKKFVPFSIHYSPHNVDTFKQAQCLRELFLNWANRANIILNY
jgi:hypothetical protein